MVEARDLGHNITDKEIAGNVSDFVYVTDPIPTLENAVLTIHHLTASQEAKQRQQPFPV